MTKPTILTCTYDRDRSAISTLYHIVKIRNNNNNNNNNNNSNNNNKNNNNVNNYVN